MIDIDIAEREPNSRDAQVLTSTMAMVLFDQQSSRSQQRVYVLKIRLCMVLHTVAVCPCRPSRSCRFYTPARL